jgi:3-dehydroquinate synthase
LDSIIVKLKDKEYPITIRKGLFDSIGPEIKKIFCGENIAVITDINVDSYYGDRLERSLKSAGYRAFKIAVPPGERSKSFDMLAKIYSSLACEGITRGDLIITLGGGVVGDLGGFAASTFLRGIPFVQVPTTLLAQIDSSIGGKVAVDLNEGKNLVGCFYHPEAVFIDPALLETLDRRYLHDGTAEAIKYGCIRDKALFEKLCSYKNDNELLNDMEYIINACCSIKRDIVERDERDTGERMLLNFGHTIGHAIEKYFNYETYTHGEAVAAGMYIMTVNTERVGLTRQGTSESIKYALDRYNLPSTINIEESNKILDSIKLDKKNIGSSLNLIVLDEIGRSHILKSSHNFVKDNFRF